ncbi:hypothetical protein LPJ66_001935 [Kickxella alabastrina]|uniref:Uncharacterized protein n=1 Tax=Kickxella alabastrina TaxID=61397 RepID=A0ACC1IRW3_9FUNG|nr:hypothetical protein LPJ66_001935 [Kickxella alabastrina]
MMIGNLWFAGGLLGVLMTWNSNPRNRTLIPSIIFIATGISMIIHQQDIAMASYVYFLFGTSLVCFGLSSICEITLMASECFKDCGEPPMFQYIPVFFMCASGISLMGANCDMVFMLVNSEIEIVAYALTLLSFCFIVIFYFYLLTDLYFWLLDVSPGKHSMLSEEPVHEASFNKQQHQRQRQSQNRRHSNISQTSTLNHS